MEGALLPVMKWAEVNDVDDGRTIDTTEGRKDRRKGG